MSWETLVWAKAQRTGSVGRKAVLMALAEYADERHSCYPSQETLAYDTEQSVRTVRTHLADLEALGVVVIERRGGDGAGAHSNRYVLQMEGNRQKLPLGQPATSGGATGNMLPLNTREHQEREISPPPPTRTPPPPGRHDYSPEFERVWAAYPKRSSKMAAFRKWRATVNRYGASVEPALLKAAVNYAAECRAEQRPEKYTKDAATFFGPDEHWRDYANREPKKDITDPRSPDYMPPYLREQALPPGYVPEYLR